MQLIYGFVDITYVVYFVDYCSFFEWIIFIYEIQVERFFLVQALPYVVYKLNKHACIRTYLLFPAIQSENEIKYFVELTRRAMCLEWNMLLGILLQDVNVFSDTLEQLKEITPSDVTLPDKMWVWLLEGINTLSDWASKTDNYTTCTDGTVHVQMVHGYMWLLVTLDTCTCTCILTDIQL